MANQISQLNSGMPSIASMKGSVLWDDYASVRKCGGTGQKWPLDACRRLVALDDALDELPPGGPQEASECAKRIIGCYRARDFVDVVTFTMVLVATLARWPVPVMRMAACPFNGIVRKFKFPPSINEVADELETIASNVRLLARSARRAVQAELA